ncbi:YpiB family protein [Bacillus thuringiensis]|uniref:YpiB family protein n=1 Tax=Bacillus thuringiensis TaxID=1428 RepID=UPI003F6B0F80
MSSVSVEKKREFIKWFLNNFQSKWRESVWVLNYVMSHDQLMKKVHFVENARGNYSRAIFISTTCVETKPFVFYRNGSPGTDPDKAFQHIRHNRDEDIYIELNFADKYKYPQYLKVLEGEVSDETKLSLTERLELAQVVNDLEKLAKAQLIDYALDTRNEELFRKLIAN